ncbi:MAG: Glutamine amidotransferase class-I [Nitrosospira multiformis]|jgi:GMP synthase-like glutamine amidotransferase|nr:Glutamine amidotransferase class-I [Nitrosospira multiformis]
MKPVAIFRHFPIEGPGYFATFLDRHVIPWQLIKIDAGESVPADAGQFGGLVFMGGPMSVNDDLPWIRNELSLIRQAVASNIPVLGHCLGGQLMAKALGGVVSKSPVKEIGWGEASTADNQPAREWFGNLSKCEVFHWHGEIFTIPDNATLLLSSPWCKNQAFALDNKHLGLQCHVEMTEEMVKDWCSHGAEEIASSPGPAVQPAETMQTNLSTRISRLQRVADKLYERWINGIRFN